MIVFLAFVVLAAAVTGGYLLGMRSARSANGPASSVANAARPPLGAVTPANSGAATGQAQRPQPPSAAGDQTVELARVGAEKGRLIRSYHVEAAVLRRTLAAASADLKQEEDTERQRQYREIADARAETARYRQLIIDIETNAPPPILLGAAGPDDLKSIVGIGPVLERMLHNLGIMRFQQIANWSERDVAEFDARLHEFPGRIERDQWTTQARELHRAKYGDPPERG